ncbi:hypothetical protein LS73_001430 [Helicobacter muridarum]|uniref:Uncharacterized protein n=1 Tax=Helicobacter muridarum TaxID=216 RepID=A0A099TXN0_9HELI|nr:hypothetical protein [Helicobacter muridarum]TLE01371.1 hypothetical protein LS73_001430 [Helicobacter muridarum]STQ85298.1 Uncharacterised protein [Helicobacter muridarum]
MKIIKVCIIASVFLVSNTLLLSANHMNTSQQADYKFLFGDESVDVEILSNEEMIKTKGEFGVQL